MSDLRNSQNLQFQSEHHPLVSLEFKTHEDFCLSLIHRKAYSRASEMSTGCTVLDLGCNNGYGTKSIAERSEHVIGVDVSPNAIAAAVAHHTGPNIEYRIVSGGALPFESESFDLVTSFQVIEHVNDVAPYLNEIRRVLRRGGKAIFTTPNRCIRLEPGRRPWNPFHVREYEAGDLKKALEAVFPVVLVEGLFATPEIYKIELDRVSKIKIASRPGPAARLLRTCVGQTAGDAIIDAARSVLPGSVVKLLRSGDGAKGENQRSRESPPSALSEFIDQHSLDDLYYRGDNLGAALDLIAICSRDASDDGIKPFH